MGFWFNVLAVIKGEQPETKEIRSTKKDVNVVQMKREVKNNAFNAIDKGIEPYNLKLGVLENNVKHSAENKKIKEVFEYYKNDLGKMFSDIEIQIMKNQAYERADLRLQFREKKGNLTRQDMGRLLELESSISPDGGQSFNKIAKELESRKSLHEYQRVAYTNQLSSDRIEIDSSREKVRAATPEINFQSR